jgi:hypothetical protein
VKVSYGNTYSYEPNCSLDDLEDEITAEELNSNLFGPDSKSDWFPYPDKAVSRNLEIIYGADLRPDVPDRRTL